MDYFREEELKEYAYEDAKDGSYDHRPSDYEEQEIYDSAYADAEDDLKRDRNSGDDDDTPLIAYLVGFGLIVICVMIYLNSGPLI
ncbi:hypothetical protein [Priestia megaterium]|uniref:hypothetical protein n=1 Tax=Priestia megaterium TaxID=1404 RepID=UPI0031015F69